MNKCKKGHPLKLFVVIFSRIPPSKPGTINVRGNIINMFAQYYPGKWFHNDTYEMRLQWFKQCLAEIEKVIRDTDVVAFPYNNNE